MERTLDYDYIMKYILIGDTSVGKSTILNKFINDSFMAESNPTMGVEFATKKINVDGSTVKIQIWDTVIDVRSRQDRKASGPSPGHTTKMQSESYSSTISHAHTPSSASTPGSRKFTTTPMKLQRS
jgi:GTPase SAR1 family protein